MELFMLLKALSRSNILASLDNPHLLKRSFILFFVIFYYNKIMNENFWSVIYHTHWQSHHIYYQKSENPNPLVVSPEHPPADP